MVTPAKDKPTQKIEKAIQGSKWNIFSKATAPSTAVNRPMTNVNPDGKGKSKNPLKKNKSDKNEIFVDIFEKLSVSNSSHIINLNEMFYRFYSILTALLSILKSME
jgi:hypothetical protein